MFRLPRRRRYDARRGGYYVTVRSAGRVGFLLGPFRRHAAAVRSVRRVQRLAETLHDNAGFYAYGTARLAGSTRPGLLNDRLGFEVR